MREGLENFSPGSVSISNFTQSWSALFLPSLPRLIRIGTGFDSRHIGDSPIEPWKSSIFEETIGREKACIVDMTGTESFYKQCYSTSTRDTSEHFSASLGVTIGNDFLSGSVSGSYDKAVSEIEQGTRASRTVSSRLGRILLRNVIPGPEVLQSGLKMSSDAFRHRYGDYFVVAYTLGVDRGAFLHATAHAKSRSETSEVTVSVHSIIGDASHTDRHSFSEASKDWHMTVMGYDTLKSRFARLSSGNEGGAEGLSIVYNEFNNAVNDIDGDIAKPLEGMDLRSDHQLSFAECDEVYRRGLVSQIVLLPYKSVAGLLS